MHVQVKITAIGHQDPESNLFTYIERYRFPLHQAPSPSKVRELCMEHKNKYLETWPYSNVAKPILVPMEVEMTIEEGRA